MDVPGRVRGIEAGAGGACVAGVAPAVSPFAALRRLWQAWRQRGEERRAIASLNALDDYQLRDLGLGRSDIEGAVRGTLVRHRR